MMDGSSIVTPLKCLVFGATGWIGGQMTALLKARGHVVLAAVSRLQDTEAVRRELAAVAPDRVVLAAGITGRPNVDWCEDHKVETAAVNVAGTVGLVAACAAAGIHITNFATGCIYTSHTPTDVFTEDDPPNFTGSFYSRTKAAAEAATRELPHHLLLRVRMPITADGAPRCFLTKIARYERVVDVPNSVSVLPTLLPLAVELLEQRDTGVWNFVNPGPVSHGQLLEAYRTLGTEPGFGWTTMTEEEQAAVIRAGRSNNVLSVSKLQARFGDAGRLPDALTAVRAELEKHKPRLRTTFTPKRLLVTGGAGFIGSAFVHHVATALPTVEYVCVLDVLEPCASHAHLDGAVALTRFERGDIGDGALVRRLLDEGAVDTVINFAAQTHVDASFDNPLKFTQTNVLGTHVLLEAVRQYGRVARFLHVSTDEVYGETRPGDVSGMGETRMLLPTNPYAASKVGAEALVHAYAVSYGLPTVVMRCNNVYGPRQYPEKVVPRFILQLLAGKPLCIQGTGAQTRHFLHVEDACNAATTVLTRGANNQTYNVGSDTEVSIQDLATYLADLMQAGVPGSGVPPVVITHGADRPFNDRRYWVSDVKLRSLGWRPHVPFDDGMRTTVAWYKDAQAAGNPWCRLPGGDDDVEAHVDAT